ncbi:MAG: hypothetical protein Q9188_007205 [Gyalolechia gomerana]
MSDSVALRVARRRRAAVHIPETTDEITDWPRLQQSRSLGSDRQPESYCSECSEVLPEIPRASKRVSNPAKVCDRCKRKRKGRKALSEPIKAVRHRSAREVDAPESSSAREPVGSAAREGPVLSTTNTRSYGDSHGDPATEAVPAGPQAGRYDIRAFCRRSALQFISNLTNICRTLVSAFVARRLYYRLPILLIVVCVLSYVVLSIRMLINNPYASDQTLLNHAALLYATHAPLPLLFAHILPTLAYRPMFRIKEDAVRRTYLGVKYEICLRLAPEWPGNPASHQSCSYPMTREQSAQLSLSLNKLDNSLLQLKGYVDHNVTSDLQFFAGVLPLCLLVPMMLFDEAIAWTRNLSHGEETLVNANELFHMVYVMHESINTYGLQAIEMYNRQLEKEAKDQLLSLERLLALLLSAHDDYDDLFRTLHEIGLAHYTDALKQILSEGVQEGEAGDGKGQSWDAYLKMTFKGRTRTPRIPTVSLSTVLSSSLYHYYSIYTLLYSIRYRNILLHRSTVSHIPTQAFAPWELESWEPDLNTTTTTFFTSPPFRHPTGPRLLNPLKLSKEERDTALALARQIRNRKIPLPPPDSWVWEHESTANINLRPFPSRIPCPWGLTFPAGSPTSLLCNRSESYILEFPNAKEGTTTWNRLLGLKHLRDVFVLVEQWQVTWGQAVEQHTAWVKGKTG